MSGDLTPRRQPEGSALRRSGTGSVPQLRHGRRSGRGPRLRGRGSSSLSLLRPSGAVDSMRSDGGVFGHHGVANRSSGITSSHSGTSLYSPQSSGSLHVSTLHTHLAARLDAPPFAHSGDDMEAAERAARAERGAAAAADVVTMLAGVAGSAMSYTDKTLSRGAGWLHTVADDLGKRHDEWKSDDVVESLLRRETMKKRKSEAAAAEARRQARALERTIEKRARGSINDGLSDAGDSWVIEGADGGPGATNLLHRLDSDASITGEADFNQSTVLGRGLAERRGSGSTFASESTIAELPGHLRRAGSKLTDSSVVEPGDYNTRTNRQHVAVSHDSRTKSERTMQDAQLRLKASGRVVDRSIRVKDDVVGHVVAVGRTADVFLRSVSHSEGISGSSGLLYARSDSTQTMSPGMTSATLERASSLMHSLHHDYPGGERAILAKVAATSKVTQPGDSSGVLVSSSQVSSMPSEGALGRDGRAARPRRQSSARDNGLIDLVARQHLTQSSHASYGELGRTESNAEGRPEQTVRQASNTLGKFTPIRTRDPRRGTSRLVDTEQMLPAQDGSRLHWRYDVRRRTEDGKQFLQRRLRIAAKSREVQGLLSQAKYVKEDGELRDRGEERVDPAVVYEEAKRAMVEGAPLTRTAGNIIVPGADVGDLSNRFAHALNFRGNITTRKLPTPFAERPGMSVGQLPSVDPRLLYYKNPLTEEDEESRQPTPRRTTPPKPARKKIDLFEEAGEEGGTHYFGERARGNFFHQFKRFSSRSRNIFTTTGERLDAVAKYETLPPDPTPTKVDGEDTLEPDLDLDTDGEDALAVRRDVLKAENAMQLYLEFCKVNGLVPEPIILRKKWTSHLRLQHYGLGPVRMRGLIAALPELPMLEHLDLRDNRLDDDTAMALFAALKERADRIFHTAAITDDDQQVLLSLDLSENGLGSDAIRGLEAFLPSVPKLNTLRLSQNHISDEDASRLLRVLSGKSTLTSLDLSHNNIGSKSTEALQHFVTHNLGITELNLGWNNISGAGAMAFAKAIGQNGNLRELNVEWNGFGSEAAEELALGLLRHTALQELDLSNNGITWTAAQVFADAIVGCKGLRRLDLSGNTLGVIGGEAIMAAVSERGSLRSGTGTAMTASSGWVEHAANQAARLDICLEGCGIEPAASGSSRAAPEQAPSGRRAFNPSRPQGDYVLNLTKAYDRWTWSQLVKLGALKTGFEFSTAVYEDEGGRSKRISIDRVKDAKIVPPTWSQMTKHEKNAFHDNSDGRPMLCEREGEEWQLPTTGSLQFKVTCSLEPAKGWLALRKGGMSALVGFVQDKNEKRADQLRMFEVAAETAYMTTDVVADLLLSPFMQDAEQEYRLQVFARLLCRCVDHKNIAKLVSANLNNRGRRKLQTLLGSMWRLLVNQPSGHYTFDCAIPEERAALTRLLEIDGEEKRARWLKCERGMLPGDTSQRGDWHNYRNVTIDGAPLAPTELLQVMDSGVVDLDYISTSRPLSTAKPIADAKLNVILKKLRLLPNRSKVASKFAMEADEMVSDDAGVDIAPYIKHLRFLARREQVEATMGGEFVRAAQGDLYKANSFGLYRTQLFRRRALTPHAPDAPEPSLPTRLIGSKVGGTFASAAADVSNIMMAVGELPDAAEVEAELLFSDDSDDGIDGFHEPQNPDEERLHWRRARELVDRIRAREILDDLACFVSGQWFSSKQVARVACGIPEKLWTIRANIVVMLFPLVVDLYAFATDCLSIFSEEQEMQVIKRLGWLNVFNPLEPDRCYCFDLSVREEHVAVTILVRLAVVEPGENWEDESYNEAEGWELPASWAVEAPHDGSLTTEYTTTGDGCHPVFDERISLCDHVLIDATPAALRHAKRRLAADLKAAGRKVKAEYLEE